MWICVLRFIKILWKFGIWCSQVYSHICPLWPWPITLKFYRLSSHHLQYVYNVWSRYTGQFGLYYLQTVRHDGWTQGLIEAQLVLLYPLRNVLRVDNKDMVYYYTVRFRQHLMVPYAWFWERIILRLQVWTPMHNRGVRSLGRTIKVLSRVCADM